MTNTASPVDRTWLTAAKDDIDPWATAMPSDADGRAIDWQWVRSLDLEHGIGCAGDPDLQPGAERDARELLKRDYAVRDRLEAIIAQCNTAFMADFDRLIPSYRLPRALAYANRRLNDEIALLVERGVQEHRWTVTYERRQRVTVPVLRALDAHDALDDVQDRTAEIVNGRAERRKYRRGQERAARRDMARANLSGVTAPGGSLTLFGEDQGHPERGSASGKAGARGEDAGPARRGSRGRAPASDWRDAYLPGRDVDAVMGIDIETTGTDPARVYIIDVGFEFMNMASPRPADADGDRQYRYEQDSYAAGDAYGQSRLAFGVPDRNARLGNPLIAKLTGIDVRERGASLPRRRHHDHRHAADEPSLGSGGGPGRRAPIRQQHAGRLCQTAGGASRGSVRAAPGAGGRAYHARGDETSPGRAAPRGARPVGRRRRAGRRRQAMRPALRVP